MRIRLRLFFIIGIFSVIATLVFGFASYTLSKRSAILEAKYQAQILTNYLTASRQFFIDQQRPLVMELVGKDNFFPEIMSGVAITRGTWEAYKKSFISGFQFKQASIDPMYLHNKADNDELKMIETFHQNPDLKTLEGFVNKQGEKLFYSAAPIKIDRKGCLRCHGDPLDAPKAQIEIYGIENGYNHKLGETVSAFVLYVPIQKALKAAKWTSSIFFLIGIGCFLSAFIGVGFFIDHSVLKPLVYLTDRTEDINHGINTKDPIVHKKNDEIKVLARAVERLRLIKIKTRERRLSMIKKRGRTVS
jgi:hypothetical protein